MKVSYDHDKDISLIELNPAAINYTEQTKSVIVHLSVRGQDIVYHFQGLA
jgi:hypothetical protein